MLTCYSSYFNPASPKGARIMPSLSTRRVSNTEYLLACIACLAIIAAVVFYASAQSANQSLEVATKSETQVQTQLNDAKSEVVNLKAQLKVAGDQITDLTANKPQADLAISNEAIANQRAAANDTLVNKLATQLF